MTRCPKCRYALVRGVCPICDGKQVGDRQPMLAPLPKGPTAAEPQRRKRYGFRKGKRS